MIRGWIPERIAISPGASSILQVSNLLSQFLLKQGKAPPARSSASSHRPSLASPATRSANNVPVIFVFRKEADYRRYAQKGGQFYQHVPCAYRITETQKMAGSGGKGFLVRHYLSAG